MDKSPLRLDLAQLNAAHPKLKGHPGSLLVFGSLALQRSGHASPKSLLVDHSGRTRHGHIEWPTQDTALLLVLDRKRVTEDGAEAVALSYVHIVAGWAVKRRLQQGEGADWLLEQNKQWLALEISGLEAGSGQTRLREKLRQMREQCVLPVQRLAVVAHFEGPLIVAGEP